MSGEGEGEAAATDGIPGDESPQITETGPEASDYGAENGMFPAGADQRVGILAQDISQSLGKLLKGSPQEIEASRYGEEELEGEFAGWRALIQVRVRIRRI